MTASGPIDDELKHYPNIEQHRSAILRQVQQAGTPLFLCERDNLIQRYQALAHSLNEHWGPHVIGYSFKTNYLVAKCGVLSKLGAWAEVVSGHEFQLARELGFSGATIVFNGPYKSDEDLRTAISERSLVNVNDHDELDRLIHLASEVESPVEVGLRVSGTLPKLGHSRFGFSLENEEASAAVQKTIQSRRLNLVALHTHLYGDTDDAELYGVAAHRLGKFAQEQIPNYQRTIKFIDAGGGFPAHGPQPKSRQTWNPQPIDVYIKAIANALRPFFSGENPQPTLIVEPGRYLTCDGIILVTQVVHVKKQDERQLVNCNGSISMVPLTHYCPQIIRVYNNELEERTVREIQTTIYGATCRENDVLYEGLFPRTQPGDLLISFAVGAYNSSLSPDFIFPSPPMELL